jgi:hypothetical protein
MREQQSERRSNDGQVPAPAARFSGHFTAITFVSLSAYGLARTDRGETRISAIVIATEATCTATVSDIPLE